ncbi:unnamed protein product [Cuscuta campestris]|uniref:Uncharacterized protein n=1 Tax=Cuscuta campestris TaxID=132261 RepID=A0A484MZ01_9ASTE|nr:unnamed protein product [Cuscuta campestris]
MTGQKIANTGMRDTIGIVREPGILGIRTVVVTETAGRNATGIMNAKEETATEIETEGKTMTLMLRMIAVVLATEVMIMITNKTGMVRRRGTLITRMKGGMNSPVIQAGITVGVRMVGTAGDTMITTTTATTKAGAASLMMMMIIQMHTREERMMVMTTVTKILGAVNGWMRTRKTMGTTARQRRSIGGQIGLLLFMIMSISS